MAEIIQLSNGFSEWVDPLDPNHRILLFPWELIEAGQRLQRKERNRFLAQKRRNFLRSLKLRTRWLLTH